MTHSGCCAAIACIALSSGLAAQAPVPVGERVRVRLVESQRQMESRYYRGLVLRGEVTAFGGDTLYIRPTPRTGVLAVPISTVRTLDRSRGVQSRWSAGVTGAIAGAIVGLAYVELDYRWGNRPGRSRGEANEIGAGIGAAVQATIGVAFPLERWRRVYRARR